MSIVQKLVQNIQYDYAATVIELLTKQFEELQFAKERQPAIALMNDVTGKTKSDQIKEILEILYENKKDFSEHVVKNNASLGMIVFGFDENGLQIQDVYLDGMANTEYSEKSPAHKLCKSVINEITEVL